MQCKEIDGISSHQGEFKFCKDWKWHWYGQWHWNGTKRKTELVSNWTWGSGWTLREFHWTSRNFDLYNSIRKKSNQTITIYWIASSKKINCKRRMLCAAILSHHLACVCVLHLSVSIVTLSYHHSIFLLFTYETLPNSFHLPYFISIISSVIVDPIHFINHSPSLSHLPCLVLHMLYFHTAFLSRPINKHCFQKIYSFLNWNQDLCTKAWFCEHNTCHVCCISIKDFFEFFFGSIIC